MGGGGGLQNLNQLTISLKPRSNRLTDKANPCLYFYGVSQFADVYHRSVSLDKRTIFIFSLIGILVISAAGYFGFVTTQEPELPVTPETIAVTTCDVEQSVAAPGTLENTSETQVLMPVDGHLSQVLVKAGESVSAGQVLASVDAISKAEAWTALKEAEDAYQAAYNYRKALEGKIWLDRVTYETRGREQVPVHHWYKGYADEETIAVAENELALKKAELNAAQTTLDAMELKAPFDGIVIEADATTNQPFHADDVLFKMIDPRALEIVANVTEEDFPLLSVGQDAEIFFDARPEVTVQGTVYSIIPLRIEGSDTPLYNIYMTLDKVPDGLADGMTADTAITIAKREGVLCLPRAIVRASSSDTAILKIWNGAEEVEKEIQVGLRGDTYVEIVSGLDEGEQVVTR
jgi:macrolide-specific efflux system membrane fusion protein